MKKSKYTRREFLKNSAGAAAAGALYLNLPNSVYGGTEARTRVVLVRHRDVIDAMNKPDPKIVRQMLDDAVCRLMDVPAPDQAWKKIVKPADTVGIKSNEVRYLPTPQPVEEAIRNGVLSAGVAENRIGINDRGVRRDPLFSKATALINVRPLRTHHWSGVGSLLKNYIMFVKKPYEYHPDTCADLAAIWKLPEVAGKTRLNVLVLFTPLFHGIGPHHFNPKYTWQYKGLLVGTDPVAVDSVGVRLLTAKRKAYFGEDRPLTPPPKHIVLADTRHHLGTADPAKIDLIKLGWSDEILI